MSLYQLVCLTESDKLQPMADMHAIYLLGNEVFNNYGAKPNDELMLGYGFVMQDNPSDIVSLRFGAQGDDERIKLLEGLKIPISKSHYIRKDYESIPEALKAQVRVLVADEEEVARIKSSMQGVEILDELWKTALGFVSWPNELEMLDQLAGMFEAKLVSVQRALDRTQAASRMTNGKKRQRSASPGDQQRTTNGTDEIDQQTIRENIREMIEIYLQGESSYPSPVLFGWLLSITFHYRHRSN